MLLQGGEVAHLADECLVEWPVMGDGLLEEGEEDRDDDCCFESLSEGDEEDGNGEDVGHFVKLFATWS